MISQQCAFSPTKEGALYECKLSFLAGSVSSSIYQMRLSKTKDFTFPHSFNKSHLSNVIISRISITVNSFFCISVLSIWPVLGILLQVWLASHIIWLHYLSWRKSSLLPDCFKAFISCSVYSVCAWHWMKSLQCTPKSNSLHICRGSFSECKHKVLC